MSSTQSYESGDRKVTIDLIQSNWDSRHSKWEVTLFIRGRIIEKRTVSSLDQAEIIAETFVGGLDASKVLLNE
jgi:hypothetical protein